MKHGDSHERWYNTIETYRYSNFESRTDRYTKNTKNYLRYITDILKFNIYRYKNMINKNKQLINIPRYIMKEIILSNIALHKFKEYGKNLQKMGKDCYYDFLKFDIYQKQQKTIFHKFFPRNIYEVSLKLSKGICSFLYLFRNKMLRGSLYM